MRQPWLFLFVCCALLVSSCQKKPKTPEDAIEAYAAAVKAKDAKAAYALLGEDLKKRFPTEAAFEEFFVQNYNEILAESEEIRRESNPKEEKKPPATFQIEASLPLKDKDGKQKHALLRKTPQGWIVLTPEALPKATELMDAVDALKALSRKTAEHGPFGYYLSEEAKREHAARLKAFAETLDRVTDADIEDNKPFGTVRLRDGRLLHFYYQDDHWELVTLPEELMF